MAKEAREKSLKSTKKKRILVEEKTPASKNIMTARKFAVRKKTIFSSVIADILFGYCVLYWGEMRSHNRE